MQRKSGWRMTMKEVLSGNVSPIAYYMEKVLMEIPMLADYMENAKVARKKTHETSRLYETDPGNS